LGGGIEREKGSGTRQGGSEGGRKLGGKRSVVCKGGGDESGSGPFFKDAISGRGHDVGGTRREKSQREKQVKERAQGATVADAYHNKKSAG